MTSGSGDLRIIGPQDGEYLVEPGVLREVLAGTGPVVERHGWVL